MNAHKISFIQRKQASDLTKKELKHFLKISIIFWLCFSFTSCKIHTKNEDKKLDFPLTFKGKVTAIKDGDTYKVLYDGSEKTIRLAHIDCPEKNQPFGSRAKQFASEICFGKIVTVKTGGKTDRNKRILGEILLQDGTNVNKELVKNGLAWHFKKYSDNNEYAGLETTAKQRQMGLWADKEPIAPWEWRKK